MSAVYGITTGDRLYEKLPKTVTRTTHDTIRFTEDSVFIDNDDLLNRLDVVTPQVINSWERIILTDYGFTNLADTYESVRKFQAIQDKLIALGVSDVKLNYITVDTNIYEQIKRGLDGFEGILYRNTEVFIQHEEVSLRSLIQVMRGERDGRGYHLSLPKPASRIERYEESRRELMEDAQTVNKDILEYEKDVPASRLSKRDYSDLNESDRNQEEVWLREAEQEGYFDDIEGEEHRIRNTKVNINIHEYDEPASAPRGRTITQDREPTVYREPPRPQTRPAQTTETDSPVGNRTFIRGGKLDVEGISGINDLRYLYNQLLQDSNTVTDTKLAGDKGSTIMVSGMANSGASGIVAQIAEVYAMVGLRVMIIDLDITKRMQPVYFSNFDRKIEEGYGLSNGLLNVANGGYVKQASVPVTSRISICGLSRGFSKVSENEAKSITQVLDHITKESHESGFDIVLVDVPFRYIEEYAASLSGADRIIMVLDNKPYEIEQFLGVMIPELVENNSLLGREYVRKMSIILNKMRPNTRDYDGLAINRKYIKNLLYKEGNPYDDIFVAGELPFYEGWEDQFLTNKRFVWENDICLSVVKNLLREAV